jgi:hypothetical protein
LLGNGTDTEEHKEHARCVASKAKRIKSPRAVFESEGSKPGFPAARQKNGNSARHVPAELSCTKDWSPHWSALEAAERASAM